MKIDAHELAKTGDYYAFQATVWHDEKLQFTLIKRLTGTELAIALNKKCVKNLNDALQKMRQFTINEAKRIFESQDYSVGQTLKSDYSPCW